jgi:hypothetical protein
MRGDKELMSLDRSMRMRIRRSTSQHSIKRKQEEERDTKLKTELNEIAVEVEIPLFYSSICLFYSVIFISGVVHIIVHITLCTCK